MNENDEKNKLEDNEENLEKETQEELIPIDATVFLEIWRRQAACSDF